MDLFPDPEILAKEIKAEIKHLPNQNTSAIRSIRLSYSEKVKSANPEYILRLARLLCFKHDLRWVAYEIIADNPAAFRALGAAELEEFGQGINSWWTVDSFARTLSGPAWQHGQISDDIIHQWACSTDPWWRRAALVSTVALNLRSKGGRGDVPRTLAVCQRLADDHEDMVVKALSWSLRELVVHDPQAVDKFLQEFDHVLAARVKREVGNKLNTGHKTPRRIMI